MKFGLCPLTAHIIGEVRKVQNIFLKGEHHHAKREIEAKCSSVFIEGKMGEEGLRGKVSWMRRHQNLDLEMILGMDMRRPGMTVLAERKCLSKAGSKNSRACDGAERLVRGRA